MVWAVLVRLENAPKEIWWLFLVNERHTGTSWQISPVLSFITFFTSQIYNFNYIFLDRLRMFDRANIDFFDFLASFENFLEVLWKILSWLKLDQLLFGVDKVLRIHTFNSFSAAAFQLFARATEFLLGSSKFVMQNIPTKLCLVKKLRMVCGLRRYWVLFGNHIHSLLIKFSWWGTLSSRTSRISFCLHWFIRYIWKLYKDWSITSLSRKVDVRRFCVIALGTNNLAEIHWTTAGKKSD